MKQSQNIEWLDTVAQALGDELRPQMVFTGGAVVELYHEKRTSSGPRITKDVDAIVSATTITQYHEIEAKLHGRGFVNGGLSGHRGPTCRYVYQKIIFDVMPTEGKVLGFSNRWFNHAMENPVEQKLPSGTIIKLASFPRFLAIKLETLSDRGGDDLRGAHDLEDIVRLISGRKDPLREISKEIPEIRDFINHSVRDFFSRDEFLEAVRASAPLGFDQAREVTDVLKQLAQENHKSKEPERDR